MSVLDNYPKELTINRETIEASFVFCLWKNPDLYGDYEKEIRADRDLFTDDGRFYYSLGYEMYKLGYKSFDDASIFSYIEGKDILKNGFVRRGGYKSVDEIKRILNEENIDRYYDELVKSNAILKLHDEGYDCLKHIDKFRKMNYAQMEDYIEYKINNIFLKTSNGTNAVDLAVGYEKWIDQWDKGVGVGLRVGFPILNYHLAGIHQRNLILHLAGIGQGKAQPLSSKIMTPKGYVEMGDIKLNQEIYGEDGEIHRVIGIYPQGKKPVYEVKFNDNTSTLTCDEHIWTVQTAKMKKQGKFKDLTLKEIMEDGIYKINNQGNKVHRHFIPMTKPLIMEESNNYIDSYYMGLLIGDGGLTGKSVLVTFNSNEIDVIEDAKQYFESKGFMFNLKSKKGNGVTYSISKLSNEKSNKLVTYLDELDLMGLRSEEKFIPESYLMDSVSNRINLLAGLIDSDGEINNSNYTYSTSSKVLSEQVQYLVQSLGGTARIENRQTYYSHKGEKLKGLPSYRLHIKMPNEIKVFRSKKHKDKFLIGQREAYRCITEINYVGEIECQCIQTDNPTHLYLTDNLIVTHNTTSALLMYVLPILESGESICIIANEQGQEEFRQMLLGTVLFNKIKYFKMNRQKLLFGGFTEEDKVALKQAADWLKQYESNLHYVHLNDYDVSSVKRIIKKYAKLGVKGFLLDTLKPPNDASENAWADFSEVSKELFLLAQKEDIAIIATAQLAANSSNRKYLDLSCIGKSRAIAETAGQVLMFRPLRENEKEKLKVYNYVKDSNGKSTNVRKEINLDVNKDYVVLFVPKNRYGKAGDLQIVYERNMDFNLMKELGYCHIEYDGFGK